MSVAEVDAPAGRRADHGATVSTTRAHVSARDRILLGSAVLLMTGLGSLAWVVGGQPFLPAHFRFDEETIRAVIHGTNVHTADASFQVVADIYAAIGLADHETAAAVLGFGAYAATLTLALVQVPVSVARPTQWSLILGAIVCGAIYQGAYSKDLFTLGVAIAFITARGKGLLAEVVPLAAMLSYAAVFRTYWYLVAALYLALRVVLHVRAHWSVVTAAVVTVFAGLALVFPATLGVDLDHYRLLVNEARSEATVNTAIGRFVDLTGPVGGFVNSIGILASLIVPIPLALTGGPVYVLVAVFLALLWGSVMVTARRGSAAAGSARLQPAASPHRIRMVALLIAFLCVQSIFEPDYGSYIRHLTPFFGIALLVLLLHQQDRPCPNRPTDASSTPSGRASTN